MKMFELNDIQKNFAEYEKLADNGNAEYQEKLGIYYWIKFDIYSAEKYLGLAANNGSVSAMVMLAELLTKSPMSDSDNSDAIREAFINDEIDDFDGGFDAEGFEKKKEKANELLKKAAELGDHYSMFEIAQNYRHIPGCEELAFEWYLKSAELGNRAAINDIGASYEYGNGVDKNDKLAYEWYMKAAYQGTKTAMYNVGLCYRLGRGIEENQEKAYEWYMKAAQKGQKSAQNEVAIYHNEGVAISKNPYEAYKWFRRGAISGDKHAKYNLAACYQKGNGTKVDYEKAFILYYELATLENPYALACNKLGLFFSEGLGVEKNKKQAVLWFKKGANENEPYSMLNLAECYEKGDGIEKNIVMAKKLRRKAEKILNEEN